MSMTGHQPCAGEVPEAPVAAKMGMSKDDRAWLEDDLSTEHGARFG
ncbi:hypothetical protein [Stappia stellulata]|nr:hypothetical protein [Stappia stellulata]